MLTSRSLVAASLTLALLVPATACAAKQPAKPRKAPQGLKFYIPPKPLPAGKPGDLIWSRPASKLVSLKNAASTTLVLYRSTNPAGKPIAVSGTISLPKGKAPKAGWPVISWAHGTTGIADACAPSRDTAGTPVQGYIEYVNPVLSDWLKQGYAVARTDYEGLGTPGTHPYLIGASEGAGVVDIVRTARKLDKRVGKTWISAGHSQGGHAALFAGSLAAKRAPELKLRGVAAFAPASQLTALVGAAKALTTPSGLSGLGALIVGGAVSTGALTPASILSDKALPLYPEIEAKCLPELGQTTSWGALAPAEIVKEGIDTAPLNKILDAMNPALAIKAPVLILQGDADTTVFKSFTDQLVPQLKAKGTAVEYQVSPGIDHAGIVGAAENATQAWITKRLK